MLRTLVSALKAMFFFGKGINNTKLLLKQEKRDSYFIIICFFVAQDMEEGFPHDPEHFPN